MKLFNVQDSDRPMWVVANSYGHAVLRWKEHVAKENDMAPEDVEEPHGVQHVCDEPEMLLPDPNEPPTVRSTPL